MPDLNAPTTSKGGHMEYRAINFSQKFGLFKEQWQPKVVAEMNHCTLNDSSWSRNLRL